MFAMPRIRLYGSRHSAKHSDMAIPAAHATRAAQIWLYAVAALIFATLIVGGATRLTESGLSITEWKPVTGVLPPMSERQWQSEFAMYQEIPQYRELNRGMSLDQFKTIYWWEWTHRMLARLVGAAFLLPFLLFLWQGMIPERLKARLWTIFFGGAALGAVGWWMVSSGLAGTERISVSQYRLAFHLTLASLIYAAIVWTARELSPHAPAEIPPRLRTTALALAALILLQIYLGALVAGLDAGMSFNTWPLIDDAFIPAADRLWFAVPWWRNVFENTLTVQFDHRMVAYLILLLAILHALDAWKRRARALMGAAVLAVLVTAQATLGIVTLLNVAPLGLSLAHQAMAIVVLTAAVLHAESLRAGARAATVSRQYPVEHGTEAT
jgi:cytochrome c oxidase assembly protein subunit 15